MLKEQFLLDLRLHLTFNSNGKLEGCPKWKNEAGMN